LKQHLGFVLSAPVRGFTRDLAVRNFNAEIMLTPSFFAIFVEPGAEFGETFRRSGCRRLLDVRACERNFRSVKPPSRSRPAAYFES